MLPARVSLCLSGKLSVRKFTKIDGINKETEGKMHRIQISGQKR